MRFLLFTLISCTFLSLTGCTYNTEPISNSASEIIIKEDAPVPATDSDSDKDTLTEETKPLREESFYISEISDEIFEKMQGKSFKADCTTKREDLRYLHVLHIGFDGQVKEGELVCGKEVSEDFLEIFRRLYEAGYEIEKIRLVDEYDAVDEDSMTDNNTSCFNFRLISSSNKVSKHGLGVAIDINPLYNPYVYEKDGVTHVEPAAGAPYADRTTDIPHKIDENDLAYMLFTEKGYTWGGSWDTRKDYQHFELP